MIPASVDREAQCWFRPGERARRLSVLAGAAFVVLLVHVLQGRQEGPLLIQAQKNLVFADSPLGLAMERHGYLRPPLYPLLLWGAARVGIAPPCVDELLFLGTLGLVALYVRRALPGVCPLWPVLLLAAADFNHANLYQPVAETLFVALLLLLTLGLLHEQRGGSGRSLALVAGATAGLGLTRYFALFFPVPVVAANLVLLPPLPLRSRLKRAAAALVLALAPIAWWMVEARLHTGYWTGDDRSAPRRLPEAVQHWNELTGLGSHLALTAKTLWIDFFSPAFHAGLAVVTRPWRPGLVETAGLLLVAAAALVLFRNVSSDRPPASPAPWRDTERDGGFLVLELVVVFYASTLAVWTWGNNDPINTRFLYPSYALLVLLGFHAWSLVISRGAGPLGRVVFRALYALVLTVQLWRSLAALPQPVR